MTKKYKKKHQPYPAWVCEPCGRKYAEAQGTKIIQVQTYHTGDSCGVCRRDDVPVTEPRDWGYPDFEKVLPDGG